jgi:hypothetical protein
MDENGARVPPDQPSVGGTNGAVRKLARMALPGLAVFAGLYLSACGGLHMLGRKMLYYPMSLRRSARA